MGRENTLEHCLEQCRKTLTTWNSQVFGHVGKNIERIQGKLQSLEAQVVGLSKQEQISETRMELNKLYAMEEDMWHQRSRSNWAKSGDKNKRYFHEKASSRKRKSTITGLMDESNQWQEDPEVVKGIAVRYYQNLFSSNQAAVHEDLLDAIDARVSEPMNALLIRDFQAVEVRKALKQMHPLKAPRPDGMNPLFYQHFWPTVGDCITKCVLDFLNLGIIPPKFNETHITRIPKVKNPKKITEYRPISLSNVVSRIASKCVANRLKVILPTIISENQSAFMANRLITDNILVAFEDKKGKWL